MQKHAQTNVSLTFFCMTEDWEARIIEDLKTPWADNLDIAITDPEKKRTWLGLLTPQSTTYLENRKLMTICL